MNIDNKTVVSVDYHLTARENSGAVEELVEKTDSSHPFVFLFGSGNLLELFEKNLKGKKKGDKFDFYIDAANGYGVRDEEYVANIPLDSFKGKDGELDEEMIQVGNSLPMVDNQGNRLEGEIIDITSEFVRMDFNHPLAGMELHFVGEVLDVRAASAEEIAHGHVHGPGGHHH